MRSRMSRVLAIAVAAVTVAACSAGPQSTAEEVGPGKSAASAAQSVPALDRDGWTDTVYGNLTPLAAG